MWYCMYWIDCTELHHPAMRRTIITRAVSGVHTGSLIYHWLLMSSSRCCYHSVMSNTVCNWMMQCLKHGVELGADSAAGWKALAELQYQNRQFQEAYDTAVKGLEWSVKRRRAGHETLTSFALALRLVVAQCLRRLNRLDEAEYNFKILAGGRGKLVALNTHYVGIGCLGCQQLDTDRWLLCGARSRVHSPHPLMHLENMPHDQGRQFTKRCTLIYHVYNAMSLTLGTTSGACTNPFHARLRFQHLLF